MKKLKIAYYTEVSMDLNDGPGVNESEFLKCLKEYSSNDLLFVTNNKNEDFCIRNGIKKYFLLPDFTSRYIIINIILAIFTAYRVNREKVDILVCRLPDIPLLPFFYKLIYRNNKLAIKTAAIWYIDQEKPKDITSRMYARIKDFFMRKVYKMADAIDSALPNAIHTLIKDNIAPENKIHLIDNGINVDKFSKGRGAIEIPLLKECFPILGFMGSLPSVRGGKQALEVARRLRKHYPRVAVMILGCDDNLEGLIDEYKLDGFPIYAPGILPYNNIEQYVNIMTIGFSFYEPWTVSAHGNASQKVRQYISCGKPVFSIHHNHQFLVDHELGSIFKDEDYKMMEREALTWLKKIANREDSFGKNIREYAIKYLSCKRTFLQRIALYQGILRENS
jgi:glycosyltransferase involved in cell wall biosynthesis